VFGTSCATTNGIPTDGSGRWLNVFLGQTVTLAFNIRLDKLAHGAGGLEDLGLCEDGSIRISPQVLAALGSIGDNTQTVHNLLELANLALAGQAPSGVTVADDNAAVSAVNEGVDGCKKLAGCAVKPVILVGGIGTPHAQSVTATVPGGQSVGDAMAALPERLELSAAIPNPFSSKTQFMIALPKAGNVHVSVYDVLGRSVATLASGRMEAGRHSIQWDGQRDGNAAAGVYFVRMTFTGENAAREERQRTVFLVK